MATADELLSEALRLPTEERARLVQELLRSLEAEEAAPSDAQAEWDQEVGRRAQAVLDGTVKTVPWSEVRARIAARLQRSR